MSDLKTYSWHAAFKKGVLETNPAKMLARVDNALTVIENRLRSVAEVSNPERRELEDARKALEVLRAERANR